MLFDVKAFSQRLKDLRQKEGLTQEQLADIVSVSANYLGKLENGTRSPSLDILIQLSSLFHVTLDFLVTGNQPNEKPLEEQALMLAAQLTAFATAKIASNPDKLS